MFQLRSSWADILSAQRFVRHDFSISCVFSIGVCFPTSPASTIYLTDYIYLKITKSFALQLRQSGP